MRRPLISTLTAGCIEAVEEGKNGFLVPIKNAAALADGMRRFCALDTATRAALGDYGHQKALTELNDEKIAEEFLAVILEK